MNEKQSIALSNEMGDIWKTRGEQKWLIKEMRLMERKLVLKVVLNTEK